MLDLSSWQDWGIFSFAFDECSGIELFFFSFTMAGEEAHEA
jgi:hypothetical protein